MNHFGLAKYRLTSEVFLQETPSEELSGMDPADDNLYTLVSTDGEPLAEYHLAELEETQDDLLEERQTVVKRLRDIDEALGAEIKV